MEKFEIRGYEYTARRWEELVTKYSSGFALFFKHESMMVKLNFDAKQLRGLERIILDNETFNNESFNSVDSARMRKLLRFYIRVQITKLRWLMRAKPKIDYNLGEMVQQYLWTKNI